MNSEIRKLLESVQAGETSVDDAMLELKKAPFEDIGYAKVDLHRKVRQGAAEVIYGAGKTPEQIGGIIDAMRANGQNRVLITRMSPEAAAYVGSTRELDYHKDARVGIVGGLPQPDGIGKVVIATGGTSDQPVAEEAALTQLLSTLEKHQSHATLLLTPELPESAGDGVRRAAATGNAVALRIDAATAAEALAQIERGNDALWRAASLRTRLVYLESADKTLRAAVVGAGYCPITINTSDFTRSGTHCADTALKWVGRSTSVRLYLGAESGVSSALGTALSRLRAENCTIAALNEVTA